MINNNESVLMSVGQPSFSCLTKFTGRQKRRLETVLIQSTCQALYPCQDENISVLQGGVATTKLLRETVVRSNKIRKLLPSKSNNQLDSMCSIFLSTTSDVNTSESLEREEKQTRPRRKTASTDNDKRDTQKTHTKETEGNVAKRKLRYYHKERTLANFEHVNKGKRRSARINTVGQVDRDSTLEKLLSLKVTCCVTSPGKRSSSERKTSDRHLEQEQNNRKLKNKSRDEISLRNIAKNSKVDSKVKSKANKRREEQLQTTDAWQKNPHHDQKLTCEETIHPRRSQRTPKPITDRLTINWENVKSCHQGYVIEQARKITFLSSTKQCSSGKKSIRNRQKHDKRIQTTSVRKSSRKIKRVEQLVVTWDKNKRYHSRACTECFTRKPSDTCAVHGACIPSEQPIQVLLSENLVRNLDTTRFQEADCKSLLNTTTNEQQNMVTLDNTTLGIEQRQSVRKTEEEINPVPKLNVIQQIQPISQSVLRRSCRKPQPTASFTATWTDQCAVTHVKVASSQNIITTTDEKCIQHGCNIAVSKVSSTSACEGNHAPCFNSQDIPSLSQSAPTETEIMAISEDVLKSEDKTVDASTKQNNIEICDIPNLTVSPHHKNKELQHNGGSLLVTHPRIKTVKDKFSTRKTSRKAQPADRFTITWSKRERSSKLENAIASATKTVSGYQYTSNSPNIIPQEGTEVSKQKSSSSLFIHQRDTRRATTGDFDNDDDWTNEEMSLLWHTVMAGSDPTASNFWNNVAQKIKSKNATECHNRWFCMDRSYNCKGGTRVKKTDIGRGKNFLARSNYMNNHDANDIFNATPMLGNSFMYQRLPAHIVLPQLEDFNSPIIRSPAITWSKDDGIVLNSSVTACQKIISRRSPILDKKGYKGYLKSLSRKCKFLTEKRKKKSSSQVDTVRFTGKKKKTVNMPLRATFADGNIEMSATLHDGNLELHGPSDSDLEDFGFDPKPFDDNGEMEYIS